MKTCKDIKREQDETWDAAWKKFHVEIGPATRREFPLGAKVFFLHGLKKLEGVVVGHGEFDHNAEKVKIKNPKTGTIWDKPSWEIELVPVPKPETTTERLQRETVGHRRGIED